MTRLDEWVERVASIGYYAATSHSSRDAGIESLARVLAREVRAFVTELCGNRDAFLDASSPVQQGEPPRCKPWCGQKDWSKGCKEAGCFSKGGRHFCTPACRDAGKPLHPPQPSEEPPRADMDHDLCDCGRPRYMHPIMDGRRCLMFWNIPPEPPPSEPCGTCKACGGYMFTTTDRDEPCPVCRGTGLHPEGK